MLTFIRRKTFWKSAKMPQCFIPPTSTERFPNAGNTLTSKCETKARNSANQNKTDRDKSLNICVVCL